jgi:hypothetical protein
MPSADRQPQAHNVRWRIALSRSLELGVRGCGRGHHPDAGLTGPG